MIVATNRRNGFRGHDGGMFHQADSVGVEFDTDAQPILARMGANICAWSTIDIVEHAKRVAAVAVDAKRNPKTRFARATL